ncbi:putative oxidoreductase [Chitinophaga niastensis]|uniref:Putative oxidoreductase n=1 Tax=Chitinophaga niastensis TaxID=536980 RepID=A0A2P8HDK7_CHINA|nr:DoxX family protein [Chitinophaga niastensis]PSL44298.1 putative oxidoreductase [Chitinophaga niastensis]
MLKKWYKTSPSQSNRSVDIIRIVVALILIVHPIERIYTGHVALFGRDMDSWGLPFGLAFAWFITLMQIACSLALIFRRLVVPGCIGHICILTAGIVLIHAADGWFVVGGGTDGMEFSVTLIACFFAVLWAYWPRS